MRIMEECLAAAQEGLLGDCGSGDIGLEVWKRAWCQPPEEKHGTVELRHLAEADVRGMNRPKSHC